MNAVSALNSVSQFNAVSDSQSGIGRAQANAKAAESSELRETFDKFVGEVFFGQMLESMRKTVGKPAYMHGGRGEEVFQKQLDQVFSEEMTKASASQFTGPMFELFALNRS